MKFAWLVCAMCIGCAPTGAPPTPAEVTLGADELSALLEEVATLGDAARGEAVFRRAELTCFNCHALSGGGGKLGPDLFDLGTRSPVDYILEALLTPNKTTKEDYKAVVITTTTGMLYAGIIQDENADAVTLRDAIQDAIVIPRSLIAEIRATISPMSAGLTASLTHGEFLDLARFLSELGKPGAFEGSTEVVARRWRVLELLPAAQRDLGAEELDTFILGAALMVWRPAYSMVSGELPVDALAPLGRDAVAYARTEVEILVGGSLALDLNSTDGLTLWIDSDRVSVAHGVDTIALEVGVHTMTFRTDLAARGGTGLRVGYGGAGDTPAHFMAIGGR